MESSSLILAALLIIPVGMMMFLLERRMRTVVLFFIFGVFMAFYASEIDGFILSVTDISKELATENVAPITEEVLKSLPIIIYAFLFHPGKQRLISTAVAVGVGFSLFENVFFFLEARNVNLLWALMRGFGSGMMHALCTLAIGYVMSEVVKNRVMFFSGSLAALSISVIYHSIFNLIVQSEYSFIGFLLPILTYIPFLIFLKSRMNKISNTERKTKND